MRLIPIFLCCFLCLGTSQAQIAYWQKFMGGTSFDKGLVILPQQDGTLFMAGETQSTNGIGVGNHGSNYDVVLMKYATQGKILWRTLIGGRGDERLGEVVSTLDGGFLVIGTTYSSDGDITQNAGGSDIFVAKVDAQGNLSWLQTFGGRGDDQGLAALQTQDGGFLIGGESGSINHSANPEVRHHGGLDSWVAKLSSEGKLEWERLLGGSKNEQVCRLHQLRNGHFWVVNNADSPDGDVAQYLGGKDIWLTELDEEGDLLRQFTYGGSDNDDVHASAFDSLGNLILGGTTFSDDGDLPTPKGKGDCWVLKIDPQGDIVWSEVFGGPRPEGINDLIISKDGGAVFCGLTWSQAGEGDIEANQGYYDAWLVKIDQNGQRVWSRTLGYAGKDVLSSLIQVPNGGYVGLGYVVQDPRGALLPTHSGMADFWLVNFDNPGQQGVRPYVTPPLLFGKVLDRNDDSPLKAQIILTDNRTLDSLTSASTGEQGEFIMTLPAYGLVSINVLASGYMFYGRDIRMDTVAQSKTSTDQVFRLEPIKVGASLALDNLYFETGKWDLLPASYAELERLLAFLELNPRVWIQINGHTDNTGNPADKLDLSLYRAEAVRDYLLAKGVRKNRLQVKGYGMGRPRASNRTAAGRRANRRVEFEIIKD